MRRQELKVEVEINARAAISLRGKRVEYPAQPIRIVFPRD
jgi:hypothetical protein